VRFFEWNGTMIHAKTGVADGHWARVGSTNLNFASWFGNCELDAGIENDAFAGALERMFLEDLENSTELVLGPNAKVLAPVQSRRRERDSRRGTGSAEITARAIHDQSARKGPFVPVNCAAMAESLFESELFGHKKGSFTGADRRRQGHIERANSGTLVLDELTEIRSDAQAKLLRVIEEKKVRWRYGRASDRRALSSGVVSHPGTPGRRRTPSRGSPLPSERTIDSAPTSPGTHRRFASSDRLFHRASEL
jgi:hypothetical protein